MSVCEELYRNSPVFTCENADVTAAFDAAKQTLFNKNTVPCDMDTYNSTGKIDETFPYLIKAGGAYDTPWTRDASINSWSAANIMAPTLARNTLFAQCKKTEDGSLIITPDNQVWDRIVWVVGAYHHYLVTRDEAFFEDFYEILVNALTETRANRFNDAFGLYFGGSFFNDGISGYPACLHTGDSDFMGHHPLVETVMSLSTNCIYFYALKLGVICAQKKEDTVLANTFFLQAKALKTAVLKHFMQENGKLAYLVYADGSVCPAQEAFGNIFAVLFGVIPADQAKAHLDGLVRSEHGIFSIYPAFEGVSTEEKPGRHNNIIWPFANGLLCYTAARAGNTEVCFDELQKFTQLVKNSGFSFFEIYNGYTGEVFGGWQKGVLTDSRPDQTWSATTYIKAIVNGIMGIDAFADGVHITPCLPEWMGTCSLKGLTLGKTTYNLTVSGSGNHIVAMTVDGKPVNPVLPLPMDTEITYNVAIIVE